MENLPEELPIYFFWWVILTFINLIASIGYVSDVVKNGFSNDHLIFYFLVGAFLWVHWKNKGNERENIKRFFKKQKIEVNLRQEKEKFLESPTYNFERFH